jgi:anti-sigma regulatory factor (Ser/Thr protein kinase)
MESAVAMGPIQRTGRGGGGGFRLQIGGGALAAGRARRELSRLRADLDPPLLESVRLLVTELVTNSVRHAGAGTVELAVLVGRERVRVEIANSGSPFEPDVRAGDAQPNAGWGLFLVDRLSDAWGVVDGDAGSQRVWFEVRRGS